MTHVLYFKAAQFIFISVFLRQFDVKFLLLFEGPTYKSWLPLVAKDCSANKQTPTSIFFSSLCTRPQSVQSSNIKLQSDLIHRLHEHFTLITNSIQKRPNPVVLMFHFASRQPDTNSQGKTRKTTAHQSGATHIYNVSSVSL